MLDPTSSTTTPTPRHDGWTAERRARFLDSLAARGNVRLACRRVNLSPEAAYRLKRRDPQFARGWAAALVLAHDGALAELADRAIDGVEEAVWYRGEQVGTRRRFDSRLLLAHLARLDEARRDETAQADAGRFDELVACMLGERAPGSLAGDDPVLPLDRETAARQRGAEAEAPFLDRAAVGGPWSEAGSEDEAVDELEEAALTDRAVEAWREGCSEGEALWDAWFADACGYVDRLTGWDDPQPQPGLPGNPLPEALERAIAQAASRPCESGLKSFPGTLSTASTSALAESLASRSGPPSARWGRAPGISPRHSPPETSRSP
jgi:hypothetical protein